MLNEHNTVFAWSGPLYATGVFLAPPESSTAYRALQPFLQASLGDRLTDRPTDHATRLVTILAERTVEKPNSVIVYGYNKYLLEQSTQIHHACLSFVSVHQMAPPSTEVGYIQLHLTIHLWTPKVPSTPIPSNPFLSTPSLRLRPLKSS